MSENPLSSLYRSKSNYVPLPSRGKFYKSGIKLSVDNELGVMPMTIKDEIDLKSPDALFNGSALLNVIKNCVPDIQNPSEIPICDIDSILFAIKAASENMMEIQVECPECNETNSYNLSLNYYLSTAKQISEENYISHEDGIIYLKPYTLDTISKQKIQEFKITQMEKQLKSNIINQDDPETIREISNNLKTLYNETTEITIDIMIDSIYKISIPSKEVIVEDRNHIKEWVMNIDRDLVKKINKKIESLNSNGINKAIDLECSHCKTKSKTELEINPINFFTDE